jgi:hypothetical protein
MNELETTWARIVELAATIERRGLDKRAEEQWVALARLVIDFDRRVVSRPLREHSTPDVARKRRITL